MDAQRGDQMQTYLDVARGIHAWLGALQIKQKWIDAEVLDGQMAYQLAHPVKGKIQVRQPMPSERIFRSHGIALEQAADSRAKLRVYDFGGIWDPIDGLVPGEHYAATHFALLSAILFNQTKEPHYLEQALDAIEFHLFTSKHEYQPSNWTYHWDFQNYAFVTAFDLLERYLPAAVKSKWVAGLKTWQTNHRNRLANWAAMRALGHRHRYHVIGGVGNLPKYFWNLRAVARARQADGCIDDEKNLSRPIQYHVYAAALLHRIYLLNHSKRLLKWFLAGVDYLLPWIDPDGDFNYWGRGQEQIFGYAAAIYALEAAALASGNRHPYQPAADLLFRFLLQFKRDNHFPLVLNVRRDDEQFGWYDYHHTTVYNAFLGAWLGLTHGLISEKSGAARKMIIQAPRSSPAFGQAVYFKPTQFAILSNGQFFCAIGGGLKNYLTEVGLTPCHLWMRGMGWLFSCPGGPTPGTFGKLRQQSGAQENFMAPLALLADGPMLNPASGAARFLAVRENEILVLWQNDFYEVQRKISITPRIFCIDDEITFLRTATYREFRFMSFPVAIDKFTIEFDRHALILSCGNGAQARIESRHNFSAKTFRTNPRLRTAKGETQVIRQSAVDFRVERGQVKQVTLLIAAAATESRKAMSAMVMGSRNE
jgi:PAS domain-containing protein